MNNVECNEDVYKHGKLVGDFDMRSVDADLLCRKLSEATGFRFDWHSFAGYARIKFLKNTVGYMGDKSNTPFGPHD